MSVSDPDKGRSSHGITINLTAANDPHNSSHHYTSTHQVLSFFLALSRFFFGSYFLLAQVNDPPATLDDDDPYPEQELPPSRSASASSSLDPYYFGFPSPSDSPLPSLPPLPQTASTPDQLPINEPITPARNPANIDRRGLVGVGELATPRWTRSERAGETDDGDCFSPSFDDVEVLGNEDPRDDESDSPWTIEAVDGEISDKEDVCDFYAYLPSLTPPPPPKLLRNRPSIAEESGGEEILYPRNLGGSGPEITKSGKGARLSFSARMDPLEDDTPRVARSQDRLLNLDTLPTSPPSSFTPARRAKKRSSDEFEMDQHGVFVSKRAGSGSASSDKASDEKTASVRKHRSLNVSTSSVTSPRDGKTRDRRRESLGLSISAMSKLVSSSQKTTERHSRQLSAGSTSSALTDARRVQNADFSHLPPSPASSSIQHLLKQSAGKSHTPPLSSSSKDSSSQMASPSVAHSLLRGTQEGWSALDDEATAEALRKLDGLTGKTARARASVGSFGRASGSSRPVTPAKVGSQWEGIGSDHAKSRRGSGVGTGSEKEGKDTAHRHHSVSGSVDVEAKPEGSTDDQLQSLPPQDKTPKKTGARMSFTPKRGSTSSTYTSTPTTSSRDSASMSTGTSLTSVSGTSGRHSTSKARRNSAGSDISSSDANLLKDRVASIAVTGDLSESAAVPPVPPLPKDISSYRSPPATSSSLSFPSLSGSEDSAKRPSHDSKLERTSSLEVPQYPNQPQRQSQQQAPSGYISTDSAPVVPKTPSKKWSFSSALNLRLSSSPSSSSKSSFPLSPRAVSFGQQRKSTSKEKGSSKSPWSPKQPDAMTSAGSLASMSSVGSVQVSGAIASGSSKTPDRGLSRPGTGSSASTNHTTSALSAPPVGPLSPSAPVRRTQSKRLTPSSIPFFRRSSSQSMQVPPVLPPSTSPPSHFMTPRSKNSVSPSRDYATMSTSVPGSASKKSSVLSLGLPSLLKSSSRRSLHSDAKDSAKESAKSDKEAEKVRAKAEKEKRKEEKEKDRSESRISRLMIRKRGKTLSSTDPGKPKSPVAMPPMQISALEPATAQRVAKLKSSTSSTASATPVASRTPSTSSRFTAQTVSSMQKQSDASLRSRNQLPTIAGSPSVGTVNSISHAAKENREPSNSSLNIVSGLPKETPTKIPRISSAAAVTPPLKNSSSALATRRASGLASTSANPSPTGLVTSEFGVINDDGPTPKSSVHQSLMRSSPSTATSRLPRQATVNSSNGSILPRKSNRDSMSFIGLRKPSTGSVASISTPAANAEQPSSSHRFSALSPSKGLKLLGPKPSLRSANSSSTQAPPARASPSSSRQSLSTPSPVPSTMDEEELLGDEEMKNYIRRQQAKKLAAGATQEELEALMDFPKPIDPVPPSSPNATLRSSQVQYLSEFERKEIQDYASVYYIGAKSKKKMATLDNSSNNHGYDDERGDYLVVNHDHLAYRYEVIDTLGKGSFGQVLQCRDHCTGESVAIKIIRNKKRFHHQALVEIKILDNLRKWDAEESHHVIKMNDHFYFRNHLCIAMELLSINLYELIKANGFVGFTTSLIRRFTTQMLASLVLMRHHRIVHCDLKPENVLLKHPAKSAIKVIDFGSSCFEHEKIYTYIQSRFYRSPEVILGMNYHMAIDMWSLGCILAELYTGYPIFPGENEQEQLSCIMEVLGVPDKDFVNRSSRKKLFFDTSGTPRPVVNSKGRRRRPGSRTLAQALKCNDEEFVDFIAKCLVWDPERRMKPQTAMRHPFILTGRRRQAAATTSSRSTPSSSSLSGSRTKQVTETPKKSLISAPTPLTARTSKMTTNGVPTTPSTTHASTLGSATRSYRTSQTQSISSSYHSSRTLSGYVVSQ
ncbi:hypothetical protein P691DRAFT_659930 [Macrolepiota fuliginosa MF-IS2]|uniref:dual-specificity kinase n=1 Tax=Macrolepiota fuliginosa MF-IS2 TaxID=1400762 RepID=A0A9P5XL87_9AGAR|nr:hypothetical protein P691DRAFT_659930 [Macrolepiota fuliginosa MF-IS2]